MPVQFLTAAELMMQLMRCFTPTKTESRRNTPGFSPEIIVNHILKLLAFLGPRTTL